MWTLRKKWITPAFIALLWKAVTGLVQNTFHDASLASVQDTLRTDKP